MTHYYRKVRCPYCKKWTGHSHTHSSDLVGNPLRVCSYCNQSYWDFAYTENAIAYYNYQTEAHFGLPLLCTLFSLFMIAMGLYSIFENSYYFAVALLIIFLPCTFFAVRSLVRNLRLAINKDQRILEAENSLTLQNQENTFLQESLARLSKPEYLEFLTDHDIQVPVFFYRRIGYNPPEKYEEKHAKIANQEKAELDQLLEEQKKYRNAQYLLKKGSRSKEFREVANQCNMTTDEFKDYCRKTIEEYEAMHREYNRTHSKPAPFLSDEE